MNKSVLSFSCLIPIARLLIMARTRNVPARPVATSPKPPKAFGRFPAVPIASSIESTPRKTRRPTVKPRR